MAGNGDIAASAADKDRDGDPESSAKLLLGEMRSGDSAEAAVAAAKWSSSRRLCGRMRKHTKMCCEESASDDILLIRRTFRFCCFLLFFFDVVSSEPQVHDLDARNEQHGHARSAQDSEEVREEQNKTMYTMMRK